MYVPCSARLPLVPLLNAEVPVPPMGMVNSQGAARLQHENVARNARRRGFAPGGFIGGCRQMQRRRVRFSTFWKLDFLPFRQPIAARSSLGLCFGISSNYG